jgi:hypothetical protein
MKPPTLIDQVAEALRSLIENEQFRRFIEARFNHEAVEGSLTMDDFQAAVMIRNWAWERGNMELGKTPLAEIKTALTHAMRRYNMSRKQRRAS